MFQLVTEENYAKQMQQEVEPYLAAHGGDHFLEREPGKELHYVKYLADQPIGIMMVSHGFTESTEKYKEICYYFLREGYHVYMPDHCGHGKSYRLVEDPSLVHVDHYQRYFDDFIALSKIAQKEYPELPMYLYGHSMGGGIAAAVAAQFPKGYKKVILSSPMIRPLTYGIPYGVSKLITSLQCRIGRGKSYVVGTKPYSGPGPLEDSASLSNARYTYYTEKQLKNPVYQTCSPSYRWALGAIHLNTYLRTKGYKTIAAPVLLIQAGKDTLVNNDEQDYFVEKINQEGKTTAKKICFEDAKHEIFNADDTIALKYWETVFSFFAS